jgi:hypothetical protein
MKHITRYRRTALGREYLIPEEMASPEYTLLWNNKTPTEQPVVVSRRYSKSYGPGPRILAGGTQTSGYPSVRLRRTDGTFLHVKIAEVVCAVFHGLRPSPLPDGTPFQVCHKVNEPFNSRPNNVFWGTETENMSEAHERKVASGRKLGLRLIRRIPDQVIAEIRWLADHARRESGGARGIALRYKVSDRYIFEILAGRAHRNVNAAPPPEYRKSVKAETRAVATNTEARA